LPNLARILERLVSVGKRRLGKAEHLALYWVGLTETLCGNYVEANTLAYELVAVADEKGSPYWKSLGMKLHGWLLVLGGRAADAAPVLTSSLAAHSTMGTLAHPLFLSSLACALVELSQSDPAWRCITEATTMLEATKERAWEAEVNRIAGEIALLSPEREVSKARAYFERALAVARQQQAKSWELRAAMSMARLWRDQGKRDEARDLLAPVYGWFTEGFDTLDLKEAKKRLDELS
jgi:predicted ATPase